MEDEDICKLCLKTVPAESSFVCMDDGKRDMLLYTIPHNVILDINSILKICKECSESLQTSYEFKTFCFEPRDIKDLEINETAIMVQKSEYKCSLCWLSVEINAPDEIDSEQASLELMMKECLPDLNVNLKDNLTLCAKCSISLKNMFSFIRRHLESVDKMNSMIFLKPENKDQASSYKAQFCFVKRENTDTYSEEADTAKYHISPISVFEMKSEEQEDDEFDELTGRNDAQVKTEVIKEDVSEQEIIDQEYVEMKLEGNEETALIQPTSPSFNCTQCSYKTSVLRRLKAHSLKHKDRLTMTMFKCYNCSFETKRKTALKMHLLTHRDPSEVKMFKCQLCSFETIWIDSLKKHQTRHESLNKGIMYKCKFCSYETNKKHLLKSHLLRHKSPSEITMYKCDWCPYETKRKGNLREHVVKHKEPSEITMYKCGICPYATKWQSGIKAHRMTHRKHPSHKCDKCDFEADKRSDLLRHLQNHPKDVSLKIYSCELCAYSTQYKTNLNKHMNMHKDSSEAPTFQCDQCSYVTKHRTALKNHSFLHMDKSKLTLFKCDLCSYETFRRSILLKHVGRHNVAKEEH